MINTNPNFFELPTNDLLILNFILTLLLANGLNANQLNILGNFFCSLGQNILTIQAVIGALPNEAVYTVNSNPKYCQFLDQPSPQTISVEELQNEIVELNKRLQQLEHLLTLEKA